MSVSYIDSRPEYQCERHPQQGDPDYFCQSSIRYNYDGKIPRPSIYPAETTIYNDLPDELVGPERLINHDHWVTQNTAVHDRKFYREERDFQPKHPQAPSHDKIQFIRPDYHLKIQGVSQKNMKAYNPCPVPTSETHGEFKARYPEANMFGPPGVFITDHIVYMPLNRVNVRPAFTYDDMFSVMRKAHPYMTTYRIYHKNFEDELPQHQFLDSIYNAKDTDVAIKLRTRPMLDPFEQSLVKEGRLPSMDIKKLNPGDKRNVAHMKHFFRRPPYTGCLPRVHPPVPHMGMGTSYKDSYDRPFHPNNALNFHKDDKFCFVQPRLSLNGLMRTPAMYQSENNIYGSGRNVSYYVDTDIRDPLKESLQRKDDALDYANSIRQSYCGPSDDNRLGCNGCMSN